jgi:hypothetical protein
MNCPHCQATLPDTSDAFCRDCRQLLDEPATSPATASGRGTSSRDLPLHLTAGVSPPHLLGHFVMLEVLALALQHLPRFAGLPANLARLMAFVSLIVLLLAAVTFLSILQRGWSALARHESGVRPRRTVLMLWIPIFNLFWSFVAIASLPARLNGLRPRIPTLQPVPVAAGYLVAIMPFAWLTLLFAIPTNLVAGSGLFPAVGLALLGLLVAIIFLANIEGAVDEISDFERAGAVAVPPQ